MSNRDTYRLALILALLLGMLIGVLGICAWNSRFMLMPLVPKASTLSPSNGLMPIVPRSTGSGPAAAPAPAQSNFGNEPNARSGGPQMLAPRDAMAVSASTRLDFLSPDSCLLTPFRLPPSPAGNRGLIAVVGMVKPRRADSRPSAGKPAFSAFYPRSSAPSAEKI